jgi:hypothetical protein
VNTIRRRDRGRWADAASLADLARLTEAWLTGEVASQPGYHGPVDVDEGTTGGLVAHVVRPRLHQARPGVVVTWRDGQPHTEFGGQLAAGQVRADLDGAGRPAVMAAACALQVTIWDPRVGGNTLWEHLAHLTAEEA